MFSLVACGEDSEETNTSGGSTSVSQENNEKDSNKIGNTQGNLGSANDGFIAKQGEWLFFNRDKEGKKSLCKSKVDGSEYEVLMKDTNVNSINVVGDKLYYLQSSGTVMDKFMSINLSDSKPVQIDELVNKFIVVEDTIYYTKKPSKGSETSIIYKMKVDGSGKEELLAEDYYSELSYHDGKLFYINKSLGEAVDYKTYGQPTKEVMESYLYSYDLKEKSSKKLLLVNNSRITTQKKAGSHDYTLIDDEVYTCRFVDTKEGSELISYNINDGSEKVIKSIDLGIMPVRNVTKDKSVIVSNNASIEIYKDGEKTFKFEETPNMIGVFEDSNKIYYTNSSRDYRIFTINADGTENKPLIKDLQE